MAPQIRWRSLLPRSDPARLLGPGLDGGMADRQRLNHTTSPPNLQTRDLAMAILIERMSA